MFFRKIFLKILFVGLGIFFGLLALIITDDDTLTFCWQDRFQTTEILGDCGCNRVNLYCLLQDFIGGCAIIVPIVIYLLSIFCFVKVFRGGNNVKKSYAEAVKWYRKSAEQGNKFSIKALQKIQSERVQKW